MKFTVSRQSILEAFQVVGLVISPRAIRPILSHVHMVAQGDLLTVMGTDLEMSIRFQVHLDQVEEPGEAVVPAARVSSILKECATDEVSFEAEPGGKVKLHSGKSVFHLLSENPEEYPPIKPFDENQAFGLERDKLMNLIRKTHFAVAKEKSRFAFNGAKLLIDGHEAHMIATDGKRLVMKTEAIDNSDEVSASHIVPSRALSIYEKVLSDEDDLVRIALEDSEIMLKTTRAEISSRLVEGSFPNHRAVIPEECTVNMTFPRQEFIRAFRQAGLLTSQETRSVKLQLTSGRATLSAQALDAGEARIEMDAPDYDGEELQIAFNPDFMVEGLNVMDADIIHMGFSRPNQPAKITGDDGFVYVIMPITTRNG